MGVNKKRKRKIAAVILAAGNGTRAGGVYKQFLTVAGKPLILHSLDIFFKLAYISTIVITVPESEQGRMEQLLLSYKSSVRRRVQIIAGGTSRRESAFVALRHLVQTPNTSFSHVMIHDAARPMISEDMLRTLYDEALLYGASTVGIPAIDLLYKVDKNFIKKAVYKKPYFYGFTPQCLPLHELWYAHTRARKMNLRHDVDNIELILKYAKKVRCKIIDKYYPNIKMTYEKDADILAYLLSDSLK
jgi:2-C-methyl-D-erythritol 4-phosphate cytidylyltransferase